MLVGGETLQQPDRNRTFELHPRALRLAGCVAGPSEGADQRGRVQYELERLLVLPVAHQGDIAVGLDPGRAGSDARRGALAFEHRLLRHRLREGDVGGPPGGEIGVELVGDGYRACLLARVAAGAGGPVDELGTFLDRGPEASVGILRDVLDLAVRHGRDVRVVDRGRHLRPRDAGGAVEGGEDLGQQDHPAPDARLLLHEQNLVAHIGQLDRRLHAADPTSHDQDVVVHHLLPLVRAGAPARWVDQMKRLTLASSASPR